MIVFDTAVKKSKNMKLQINDRNVTYHTEWGNPDPERIMPYALTYLFIVL